MPVYDAAIRLDAAAFARRYFARKVTLDTCLQYFAGTDDPLIQALVDAMVHEPRRGGLLGLQDWWWRSRYWEPVERLVLELEKGSEGQAPAERIYPRISLWSLILGAAFLVWAGLFAARHLDELLTDLYLYGSLPFWDALVRAVIVSLFALVTVAGIEGWFDRLRLYRTRKFTAGGRGH